MNQQTKSAIQSAMQHAENLGASFADIRLKDIRMENVRVETGEVVAASTERSQGFGIRVYVDGAMGFAASNELDKMNETVQTAFNIAKASQALLTEKAQLDRKQPAEAHYATPMEQDPFDVPLTDKLALMMQCDQNMRASAGVNRTYVNFAFRKDDVIYADTDGSYIDQNFCQCEASLGAVAFSEFDMQQRSYINVFRAGYESILGLALPNRATTIGREAVDLLTAPECPSGEFDVILTPRQMFLQIHESVGHPTELDRVLGSEAAFAGRSFIEPANLSAKPLTYGSEHVTIVADATCPRGLGTFAYDDEGVPAQNINLIDKGKFVAFQTSRAYSGAIGLNSTGGGLSDGWKNLPIVRMTNINLLPGDFTMDELIAGIEYGFIFDENKSWSIDDLRVNFQFACQMAREIKDGKLTGRIFKNPIYSGKTTEFWNSCDGIANVNYWELVGTPNCGKGQPMQVMRVSHGSSPTRFRKVKVGVTDVK